LKKFFQFNFQLKKFPIFFGSRYNKLHKLNKILPAGYIFYIFLSQHMNTWTLLVLPVRYSKEEALRFQHDQVWEL